MKRALLPALRPSILSTSEVTDSRSYAWLSTTMNHRLASAASWIGSAASFDRNAWSVVEKPAVPPERYSRNVLASVIPYLPATCRHCSRRATAFEMINSESIIRRASRRCAVTSAVAVFPVPGAAIGRLRECVWAKNRLTNSCCQTAKEGSGSPPGVISSNRRIAPSNTHPKSQTSNTPQKTPADQTPTPTTPAP